MKVNDWSSVDIPVARALTDHEQKFLRWLEQHLGREGDQYGWKRQVARLSLQGFSAPEIAKQIGCSQTTVRRKLVLIAEHRAEFEKDYWWA